jgi:hypothetical protein
MGNPVLKESQSGTSRKSSPDTVCKGRRFAQPPIVAGNVTHPMESW